MSRGRWDHDESVAGVRSFFDGSVAAEHARMVADPAARVSRVVHDRFLARHVAPGDRVLEVGAGTGRFTESLARLGATVVVTDLSPAQLAANRDHMRASGLAGAVERWETADVCDLGAWADAGFDAAVAYGGPLSYAFDRADVATAGLLRAVRPGGVVVASVMSVLGAARAMLAEVVRLEESFGPEATDAILATGDLREVQPPGAGHTCRMFRSDQLRDLVEGAGGRVVAMSASTWASLGNEAVLTRLEEDESAWARFLAREVDAAASPGALDGGTHLLVAFTRAPDGGPSREDAVADGDAPW